jgi:AcrR family transcriptional regulator
MERFNNLPPERRREILETAAEVFAERGYDGTSFNALLDRLGMGKSQAYYYFADKKDLFLTACAASYEEYYESVAQLAIPTSAEGFWSYVEELHLVGFQFQSSRPLAARLALAAAESPARYELGAAALAQGGSTRQQYRQWIALGQSLGAVRSDLDTELMVTMCIQQSALVDVWFAERAQLATEEEMQLWADKFTDLSRSMFEPRQGR